MKRFGFRVTSDRPYDITTAGSVDSTGWPAAAARAIRKHIDDLKAKGKNRKRNTYMTIKLWPEGMKEGGDGAVQEAGGEDTGKDAGGRRA
jgi:hypothetical protein